MEISLEEKIKELQRATERWWAGEAEVGRIYFSSERTKEKDVRWLTLQAARELGTAARLLEYVPGMFNEIDVSSDRHEVESMVRSVYEELRHYRLLADILECLTGDQINPQAILPYSGCLKERQGHPKLPAMTEEIAVTKRLRNEYGELAEVALSFFEGAGALIFYAGSKLLEFPYVSYSGGEIEKKIAHAMHVIFEDEMRHGPVHIPEVAKKIHTAEDFEVARNILETKAKVHLRLRNETFGYPLTEERMREIDDGINVQEIPLDYRNISTVSPYSA